MFSLPNRGVWRVITKLLPVLWMINALIKCKSKKRKKKKKKKEKKPKKRALKKIINPNRCFVLHIMSTGSFVGWVYLFIHRFCSEIRNLPEPAAYGDVLWHLCVLNLPSQRHLRSEIANSFFSPCQFSFSDNGETRTSQEDYNTMDCKTMICHWH